MHKQLTHEEFKQRQKKIKNNLVFILENFEHEENIGSAFRLADAFNIQKVIIVEKSNMDNKKISKTARNCEKIINYEIVKTIDEAIDIVRKMRYKTISVELCSDSVPLRNVNFANYETGVALILGNEKHGVSQDALDLSDFSVHIDMFGNNSSMNVSTALAIAAYKTCEDFYNNKEKEMGDLV